MAIKSSWWWDERSRQIRETIQPKDCRYVTHPSPFLQALLHKLIWFWRKLSAIAPQQISQCRIFGEKSSIKCGWDCKSSIPHNRQTCGHAQNYALHMLSCESPSAWMWSGKNEIHGGRRDPFVDEKYGMHTRFLGQCLQKLSNFEKGFV